MIIVLTQSQKLLDQVSDLLLFLTPYQIIRSRGGRSKDDLLRIGVEEEIAGFLSEYQD